ncbi:MAG: radical SAM protein [Rhodocyclaceae bacterium]|nr:radical SAM protein [Rhodocyclaceae bacterium]
MAGMTYVYPVLSRRAGGVSLGLNLNPNNACNWHCVYCQVPDLVRGKAPPIDLARLCAELRTFLDEIRRGTFMAEHAPPEARQLKDLAFSGNGEPTSAADFARIVMAVGDIRNQSGFDDTVPVRLITNGSLMGRSEVLAGVEALSSYGGEVWFKVDAARRADVARINGVERSREQVLTHLERCASACRTWIQTCLFAWDGQLPDEAFLDAYLSLLEDAARFGIEGVLLYGVARPSLQPEAPRVTAVPPDWLAEVGERITNKTGLTVSVSP